MKIIKIYYKKNSILGQVFKKLFSIYKNTLSGGFLNLKYSFFLKFLRTKMLLVFLFSIIKTKTQM